MAGRNDGNIKVIIPDNEISRSDGGDVKRISKGDYVVVQINAANSQVLKGIPLYHTTLTEYNRTNEYSNNERNVNYM